MTPAEKDLIAKFANADVNTLALKIKDSADVDSKFVLRQIAGAQVMRRKMPTWAENSDVIYPDHLPLEQCSSYYTACYKRDIVDRILQNRDKMADLTGGLGVDFFMLSLLFKTATYAERNTALCDIVRHNFGVFNRTNAIFSNVNGVDFINNSNGFFNLLYIDPARRNSAGRKTVRIEDCEPDILAFQDVMIQKADMVLVKLSPMADMADVVSKLHNVREVHLVATANECKELLVVLQKGFTAEPQIFTTNDSQHYTFTLSAERECVANLFLDTNLNEKFLFEPNAAVMKSGAFKMVAKDFNVNKLSVSSHLYVSDHDVPEFPGRRFKIESSGAAKNYAGLCAAGLAVRNFPEKAEVLKKKLKIRDGGDNYFFATTLYNGLKVMVKCIKVE